MKNLPRCLSRWLSGVSLATAVLAQTPVPTQIGPVSPRPAIATAPNPAAQISQYIRRIFQDKSGNLWFGTNGDGVCRYDGKALTYFTTKDGLGGNAIRGILQDDVGSLWFATDGGVSRYDGKAFTNYTVKEGLGDNDIWSLLRDKAGNLWAGTMEGVYRLTGKNFVSFPIPPAGIPSAGAGVEDPSSRFGPKLVWAMLEDKAGNLWFGTDGDGLRKFDGTSFTTYTDKDGLADNNVGSILQDKAGDLWFGTRFGGVSRHHGKSFTTFTEKEGLGSKFVFEMREDRAGNLWLSTLGGGVCRYDGKTFTQYGTKDGLTNLYVQSIFQDQAGKLWFGTGAGLFRLDGDVFVNVTKSGPWQ